MKNNYKIFLLLLIASFNLKAQERNSSYTNILNPFILNPALAGSTDNIYTIFNSRGVVGGINGANRAYNFGIHAPIKNSIGLGAKILSSSVGVFQTINAEGVFSKSVKLNTKNSLSFGISLGFYQTNLKSELLNRQVDLSDQALNSNTLNKMLFTSGVGLLYKYDKKAEIGISMPSIITGDQPLNNLFIANAGWNFYAGKEKIWKLKPMVNFYNFTNGLNMVDGILQGAWKETVLLAAGYRSNGSMIASAGLNFKTFAIHYAYYNQMSGYNALAPVQNEIAIAFSFNKPKPSYKNQVVNDEVIQDEIDKLNDRLNGLVSVDKTNPGLVNMKKELGKLNKDLEKVLSRYKITNQNQIQKVKNLQASIESLMTKYND